MPSHSPYSPSETYRIANSYKTRVMKLDTRRVLLETQAAVLDLQITEQQALCAVLKNVDQERYVIFVRSLKYLREMEKGVKEELKNLRLQFGHQCEILKRRISMVKEKNFPVGSFIIMK
ncbi:hypothetical protein CRE_26586 [Caenorhabditis remanei]|uniref:Uncharacterized protein n=1 Tax=Caenorhabditis remanei TaxID=31234 RepID=E3LRE7_CAERE|nr:hypothetical protein CRE_26586 [Caenorhabditis remanei]